MPINTINRNSIKSPSQLSMLPENASVKAVVIGIESYQEKSTGALTKVEFAHEDAQGFMDALESIYGNSLEGQLMLDNDATVSNIKYQLKSCIASLDEDDLFIFYYAGHGFYGQRGNRITAWDTNAHDIEGTTLLLQDVLVDPLKESAGQRTLAFVDACAAEFLPLVRSRDVVSDFDTTELRAYLASTQYFAMYLSCSPREKSYPSKILQHGIWTHFLLKALRGDAEESLGPERYLTDQGLKDYLRAAVRKHMTKETTFKGVQTPQAFIIASGSFAILEVPLPVTPKTNAEDLSSIRVAPSREYFQGIEEEKIQKLPGFKKGRHFVPEYPDNEATTSFIRQLLTEVIDAEMQDLYEDIKQEFNLRSSAVEFDSDGGVGSINTDYFRYTLEARHHVTDASKYQIVRELELRAGVDSDHIGQIDRVFSGKLDRFVVKTLPNFTNFGTLVDKLEDLEENYGGTVKDERANERVTYTATDGVKIVFSVRSGRITISARGARSLEPLLSAARKYQFGLDGPSTLLIG